MTTKKGLQSFVLYGRLGDPTPPELATDESTERRVLAQMEEWGKLEVLTSHPQGPAPTETSDTQTSTEHPTDGQA